MANEHGSNEPETTRTEPKGTDANRKTCKPTRGNDGERLAGAVENRQNSNETHPEKRNSRMTDVPGGEPGSVILANSRNGLVLQPLLPSSCGRLATRNDPQRFRKTMAPTAYTLQGRSRKIYALIEPFLSFLF